MASDWKERYLGAGTLSFADAARDLTSSITGAKFHDPFAELRSQMDAIRRPPDYIKALRATSGHTTLVQQAMELLEGTRNRTLMKQFDGLVSTQVRWADVLEPRPMLLHDALARLQQSLVSLESQRTVTIADLLSISRLTYRSVFGSDSTSLLHQVAEVHSAGSLSERDDPSAIAVALETVAASAVQGVEQRRFDTLSLEFYLSFLVALLICAYQLKLSGESEQRLVSRVAAVETLLASQVARTPIDRYASPLVYVARPTTLQASSKPRSATVVILYPGVPARVVAVERKWIRLEFFDASRGLHENGWCRKKYVSLPSGYRSELETSHLLGSAANATRLLAALESSKKCPVPPSSIQDLGLRFGGQR